jgi:DNA helicase IV
VIQNSAELAEEQRYFDTAQKHRERMRNDAGLAPSAAAHGGAARWLAKWAKRRSETIGREDAPVAFGRTDDEGGLRLYVGNETIFDDAAEVLVVSWKAPAAEPYYQASPADPMGLVRKRVFTSDGNLITDFQDVVFSSVMTELEALAAQDDSPRIDGALLAELDRSRDGAMRDIATTIHAAQYELIKAPLDQVLVIEGGPGTGKTAVALHRVSYLLFNHQDRLDASDVLVVGPHPAFTRYIRTVLPTLGDTSVDQVDIGMLAPNVRRGRTEPPAVRRLKGDARMAGLLARALEARIGAPEPAERLLIDGSFVTLAAADVSAALTTARQAKLPYSQRRQLLRERLLLLVRDRGASLERERFGPVDNLVERLWPQLTAAAFLRDLFGSRGRLTAAAGHEFTAGEAAQLYRRGADRLSNEIWSAADLPLLDEAEELINGLPRRYGHIVVDEAQDLSPMQLRSVGRRSSTGSLTVVGDLAQSTGAWARDQWDEVTGHLPTTQPRQVVALRYGYRVPRQVYEFAARLLPVAAPAVHPAQVVRDGPADPGVHQVEPAERAGRAVAVAVDHAAAGRFVGLVCPATARPDVEAALADNGVTWSSADRGELDTAINVVSPQEAKGLEFDAVVVVEPEDIVAEDERGHRLLYMVLTRTTRYLDVVCVGSALPLAPDAAAQPALEAAPAVSRRNRRRAAEEEAQRRVEPAEIDRLAAEVAAHVKGGSPAPLWFEVLQRAAELLEAPEEDASGRHRR